MMSNAPPPVPQTVSWDSKFAGFLVSSRWLLTALALAGVITALVLGVGRVQYVTESVASLGDTTTGAGAPPPIVFDPRMDLWFGAEDAAVSTWREIEDRFVAEDYVIVSFEADETDELGVFEPRHLERISRLTENLLTVPGVRHVRSLTYNPWIRWGTIEGEEEGLLITDLVEGDPNELSEAQLIERMIAVLGADRVAARLGEDRVRAVIGDAKFSDYAGEPLLLGTILSETGQTTALQVQVLRPRPNEALLTASFGEDLETADAARSLWRIQMQRASLRGIWHFLRLEQGTAVPAPEFEGLTAWVQSLPEGEPREQLAVALRDPSRNFIEDASGVLRRKYFEYQADGAGGWIDRSDPKNPVSAPEGWQPPVAAGTFHVGGSPVFERNFEDVGMADSRFIPLMFLVILLCLILAFRHPVGVLAPLAIVFGSIAGMVGFAFAKGDLMNNLTMMAPNMLTAVGIADAVHLIASWAALRTKIDDRRELVTEVMRVNVLPVLLTSVTTAIGFVSLTASDLVPVRMLGYTAGLGALIAYALSMTLIPLLLMLVPHSGRVPEKNAWLSGVFRESRSRSWITRVIRNRNLILAASAVVLVTAIVGVARIRINSDFREMFPDSNLTISDFNWIESKLGGVGDLEIIFRGAEQGAPGIELTREDENELEALRLAALVRAQEGREAAAGETERLAELEAEQAAWEAARIGVDPTFLEALDRFERRLREEMANPASDLAVVSDVISPLDILRKMHQVQNENRAADYRVPSADDVPASQRTEKLEYDELFEEWSFTPAQSASSLVAQYYLQYENGARPGENLSTQLSQDRKQFRMQGRILQAPSQAHLDAFQAVEALVHEEFPELDVQAGATGDPVADMTLSGKSFLNARTMRLFSVGFVKSMSIALVMITLIIGFLFRSATLAAVSLIPNVLPIVVPLSVFGLLGKPLDGPAILVSSVALGVCVDDTIHFFTKFVRGRRAGKSLEDSLVYALTQAGGALTITTVLLMIGFSTLLLSDFTPNFMMGTLATVMISLAWAADFVVTPALLSLLPGAGQQGAPVLPSPLAPPNAPSDALAARL